MLLCMMMKQIGRNILLLILGLGMQATINGYTLPSSHFASHNRLSASSTNIDPNWDDLYTESMEVIDECAKSGQPTDELYESVRYVDKNAFKLYSEPLSKQQLWDRCKGSWKLQLATGPPSLKQQPTFKPVPIFAYAMIDEYKFGNGIGFNEENIVLSLLGNHYFNEKKRQMGIGIDQIYLFSKEVTGFLPNFVTDSIGLGKKPEDFAGKSKMPAFTMIGASEKSMIARGGSGGIAIWTKLDTDIKHAAYGIDNKSIETVND